MNRPKLEYNKIKAYLDGKQIEVKIDLSKFGYLSDLEKYCDELEEENSKLYCLKDKRFEELIKALDKACDELASLEHKIGMMENPNAYDCEHKNSEQWKEWLLNDD